MAANRQNEEKNQPTLFYTMPIMQVQSGDTKPHVSMQHRLKDSNHNLMPRRHTVNLQKMEDAHHHSQRDNDRTQKAWIEFPDVEPSFDQVSDTESREALEAQSKIGWDKFFKGFIAQPLQHLINTQRNNQLNAFEKIRWTTEIITTIWEHQLQHWKQRNSDDHGTTIQESEEIKHQRLLKEAKELYNQKHLIPPADRAMFPSWKRTRLKTNANLEI